MSTTNSNALRPATWDDYIGQDNMKQRLRISIDSALRERRALSHVLLSAGPGTGKTSLASLIADESMTVFTNKVCPIPERMLHALLLDVGGTIHLDEIHRMTVKQQENLLSVLEDGMIQLDNGDFVDIGRRFTIIGSTTEVTKLIKPLRDRFPIKPRFADYTDENMADIISGMMDTLSVDHNPMQAKRLGRASAGIPRQAKNLALAARDLGTADVSRVLDFAEVTQDGYTESHLAYLEVLYKLGGTGGVEILKNYTNEPQEVLLEIENLLINRSCIEYTPKGRSLLMPGAALLDEHGRKTR